LKTFTLQKRLLQETMDACPLTPSLVLAAPLRVSWAITKPGRNSSKWRRALRKRSRPNTTSWSKPARAWARALPTWCQPSWRPPNTEEGSKSELDFQPVPAVWDLVESDSNNCLGKNCPDYKKCFYFKARRQIYGANLLIVNHALFFSDLAVRRAGASILPDYQV